MRNKRDWVVSSVPYGQSNCGWMQKVLKAALLKPRATHAPLSYASSFVNTKLSTCICNSTGTHQQWTNYFKLHIIQISSWEAKMILIVDLCHKCVHCFLFGKGNWCDVYRCKDLLSSAFSQKLILSVAYLYASKARQHQLSTLVVRRWHVTKTIPKCFFGSLRSIQFQHGNELNR